MHKKSKYRKFFIYLIGALVFSVVSFLTNLFFINNFRENEYGELFSNLFLLIFLLILLFITNKSRVSNIKVKTKGFYVSLLKATILTLVFLTVSLFLYGFLSPSISIEFKAGNIDALYFISYFLIISIKEELFYRFYLVEALNHLTQNVYLIGLITSLLFVLPHIPGNTFSLINIFFWGVFYYYIYQKYNKIEYNIGIHYGYNLSITIGLFFSIGFKNGWALVGLNVLVISLLFLTITSKKLSQQHS